MLIRVLRLETNERRTIGVLILDGHFQCYTLEDSEEFTSESKGCIPAGIYPVTITPSQRFGRKLPLLNHVPGFDGIRFHPGNTEADTSGCILLGLTRTTSAIGESHAACDQVQAWIQAALDSGQKVDCRVEDLF